mmetsp:Transcript_53108/g.139341  ORF Transcript_53108/g.139341 Transcript_53108/m.139341 type:complete len:222 (-) Transcript_53108:453-1118(-)
MKGGTAIRRSAGSSTKAPRDVVPAPQDLATLACRFALGRAAGSPAIFHYLCHRLFLGLLRSILLLPLLFLLLLFLAAGHCSVAAALGSALLTLVGRGGVCLGRLDLRLRRRRGRRGGRRGGRHKGHGLLRLGLRGALHDEGAAEGGHWPLLGLWTFLFRFRFDHLFCSDDVGFASDGAPFVRHAWAADLWVQLFLEGILHLLLVQCLREPLQIEETLLFIV